jgi:hypothetical protein
MLPKLLLVILAAFLGVAGATSSSCVIGLTQGTSTWCGLHWAWSIGTLFAVPIAIFIGMPAYFVLRRLGFLRWWHFLLAGTLLAAPFWVGLAQPFNSIRWQQSGFFDTINYLGSGALGALAFWWLLRRRESDGL